MEPSPCATLFLSSSALSMTPLLVNGGAITITGEGFHYGLQVWDSLVSSGVGDIAFTGTATGSDSTGVNVRDGAPMSAIRL